MSDNLPALRKDQLLFTNKNEALCFQEDYQRRGYIKKCYHAKISEYPHITSYFEPTCSQSSYLYVEKDGYFIGCPESCKYYQSVRHGKATNLIKIMSYKIKLLCNSAVSAIKWLFEWYAALTSGVQIILAICLLVFILGGSPFFDSIITLIKTFFPR